jgi:hypothetical protein
MIPRTTGRPSQSVKLSVNQTPAAQVTQINPDSWRLEIPVGPAGKYRLAQLDDYTHYSRWHFPWMPPLSLALCARASDNYIPGTWGFGLWNDPFSFSIGFGGGTRRLPALPNAIWFFFASPKNHLSLRDDLPNNGNLAAIFQSPNSASYLLIPGVLFLPLLFLSPMARLMRRLGRRVIQQEAISFTADLTEWHQYGLVWEAHQIYLTLDGQKILESPLSPRGPLGLVLWIDNQFFAWAPNGRINYGNLETVRPAWIEIKDFNLEQG